MNLQVTSMTVFASTHAREGDRHYLDLNVSMSRNQMERAICTLMGHLSQVDALHMLRTEFPELFNTTETTE